jgi:succinate dehydrogenase / fumarate reductase, cytochrome b subunit
MSVVTASPAPARKFARNPVVAFYQSSIGKKIVVAVTGICLMLFVLGHLLGNLQVYLGAEQLNAYSQHLQDLGPLLWIVRFALLAIIAAHIVATIQLAFENRAAKPQKYAVGGYQRSTLASRTMVLSGLIVLCFIVFHLLHFTFQTLHPEFRHLHDGQGRHDVYRMMVAGFRKPLISFFYALGLFLLAGHVSHGFQSVTQTLGINNRKIAAFITNGGRIFSWFVFLGFVSIPATILLHILR